MSRRRRRGYCACSAPVDRRTSAAPLRVGGFGAVRRRLVQAVDEGLNERLGNVDDVLLTHAGENFERLACGRTGTQRGFRNFNCEVLLIHAGCFHAPRGSRDHGQGQSFGAVVARNLVLALRVADVCDADARQRRHSAGFAISTPDDLIDQTTLVDTLTEMTGNVFLIGRKWIIARDDGLDGRRARAHNHRDRTTRHAPENPHTPPPSSMPLASRAKPSIASRGWANTPHRACE